MKHAWMVAALVLALVGVMFAPLPAQDKPIELKFSSWVATVHGHHTGVMVPWAKMVEEKSGGRLKITIYPGSTLGKAVDHYDMVKDGIADMGFTVPGLHARPVPAHHGDRAAAAVQDRLGAAAWPSCRSSTSTSRASSRT